MRPEQKAPDNDLGTIQEALEYARSFNEAGAKSPG